MAEMKEEGILRMSMVELHDYVAGLYHMCEAYDYDKEKGAPLVERIDVVCWDTDGQPLVEKELQDFAAKMLRTMHELDVELHEIIEKLGHCCC